MVLCCRSAGLLDTPEHQLRSKSVPVDLVLHGVSENEDGMPTVTRNGSASPKVRCDPDPYPNDLFMVFISKAV